MWKVLSVSTNLNLLKLFNLLFKICFWEIELTRQISDQEDIINVSKIVFDDNNWERKSWCYLGQTCSRSLVLFLSQLSLTLLIVFGCFWRILLSKIVANQLFGWLFCVVQLSTFYYHHDYGKVFSTKNRVFISLVGRSETGKWRLYYNWLEIWTLKPKFDKIIFLTALATTLRCYTVRN